MMNLNKVTFPKCNKLLSLQFQFNLGHEGACGEGDEISNVKLPPWASSAQDFVRIHREVIVFLILDCTYIMHAYFFSWL